MIYESFPPALLLAFLFILCIHTCSPFYFILYFFLVLLSSIQPFFRPRSSYKSIVDTPDDNPHMLALIKGFDLYYLLNIFISLHLYTHNSLFLFLFLYSFIYFLLDLILFTLDYGLRYLSSRLSIRLMFSLLVYNFRGFYFLNLKSKPTHQFISTIVLSNEWTHSSLISVFYKYVY